MEEDKRSWTCARAYFLLWPPSGWMFPGNQIPRCALVIAFHLFGIPEPSQSTDQRSQTFRSWLSFAAYEV